MDPRSFPSIGSGSPDLQPLTTSAVPHRTSEDFEQTVECILDDCFFTVGQVVGTRKVVEYDAVLWWRDHYRGKFLRAMNAFGNRWAEDRQNVTGVAMLFGERAVRYAADAESIDVAAFKQAAADVERYCQLHATRHGRRNAVVGERPMLAGYWCLL